MKNLILLLLFFLNLTTFAQNGFELSITAENCLNKDLDILQFKGAEQLVTIIGQMKFTTNSQTMKMNYTQANPGMILGIKFKDKPEIIDVIIEPNDKLKLTVKNGDISTLSVIGTNLNKTFIDYQINKNLTADAKALVRNNFITKYPNSTGSLYFNIENKRAKAWPKTFDEAYAQIDELFSNIDKKDDRLRFLPNTYPLYFRLVAMLPINNEFYEKGIDKLMYGLTEKDKNYPFNLSWTFKNLRYFQNENLEKAYVAIYYKYLANQNVMFDNKEEYSIVATQARVSEKLANGTHAPEFEMVDQQNKSTKLSEIYPQKDFTLLLFYDPECHHCQAAIAKFNEFFKKNPQYNEKLQKVAVLNVAIEAEKWKAIIDKKQTSDWLNIRSIDPKRQYENDFETRYNPAFFLLNKNGIILDKTGEINQILRHVGKI